MRNSKTCKLLLPGLMIAALLVSGAPVICAGAAQPSQKTVTTEAELYEALDGDTRTVALAAPVKLEKCLVLEDKTVTIDLNGQQLYREVASMQDDGHVIEVGNGSAVTVQNGTLSGGYAKYGGGILNNGNLTLKDLTVKENKAFDGGGILNHRTLNAVNCTLENNVSKNGGGGNLWTDGSFALLRDTQLRGGSAQNGGGIACHGRLTLEGCTVTGNRATGGGGAVYYHGYIEASDLELRGTNTVSGNTSVADGGGIFVSGSGHGSLCVRGKPVIRNNKKGSATSNVHLGKGKRIRIVGELDREAEIRFRLAAGKGCVTEDLRYATVTDVFYSDTGDELKTVTLHDSYGNQNTELQQGSYVAFVSRGYHEKDGVYTPDNKPLPENVFYDLSSAVQTAEAYLTEGSLPMITLCDDAETDSALVAGTSLDKTVLDLNGYILKRTGASKSDGGCLLDIREGTFTVQDSSPKRRHQGSDKAAPKGGILTGGSNAGDGGCIRVAANATLHLFGGTLLQNTCTGNGGAVALQGRLLMRGGAVLQNSADGDGGGIYVDGGVCTVQNAALSQNSAERGGAVYHRASAADGGLTLSRCTLTDNTARSDGGAVALDSKAGKTVIAGSTLTGNSSGDRGGAVFAGSGGTFLSDDVLQNNRAKTSSGGVYVAAGRHINLQGKMVVYNNQQQGESGSREENIGLASGDRKEQAFIVNAGLSDGSRVGITRAGSASDDALVVKNVTDYQKAYYFADEGSLRFRQTGDKKEIFMATSIRPFGYAVYPLIGMELIAAGAVLAMTRRKKNEAAQAEAGNTEEAHS